MTRQTSRLTTISLAQNQAHRLRLVRVLLCGMARMATFIIYAICIAFMGCSAESNTDADLNQEVTIKRETMLHGLVDRDEVVIAIQDVDGR